MKMKPIALQLYTLRELLNESKESFLETMQWVSDTGFKGVEGGLTNAIQYGMSAEDYKALLDDLGLSLVTGPVPVPDGSNLDEVIALKELFGFKYLFGGYGRDEFKDLDTIRETADKVNVLTDLLEQTDMTLCLHNHFWEYEFVEGRIAMDYIADWCPEVCFELDIYWASNFGANKSPEQVAKFKNRIPLLHIKDGKMVPVEGQPFGGPMCAVGQGKIDVAGSIQAADQDLLEWLVIEIDNCADDRQKATAESYRFLVDNQLGIGNK